jgi:hypothetical protein
MQEHQPSSTSNTTKPGMAQLVSSSLSVIFQTAAHVEKEKIFYQRGIILISPHCAIPKFETEIEKVRGQEVRLSMFDLSI